MTVNTIGRRPRPASLVRRLWILPVSVIVVAAIGYAVGSLQSSSYTAQSSVVVTSVPGPVASGAASGASSLASTYAGAIPDDPLLARYISRTAHVPAANAIRAAAVKGSVVRLTFTAASARSAVAGATALAHALTASRPVSSVVSAGTLKTVRIPSGASRTLSGRYRAAVVLMVPLQSGPTEGINPDDAQHLATTYAGIIATDTRLLTSVARATGESAATVSQDLSVVNEQNTSILNISFRATNPRQAAVGATKVAKLISGPDPAAVGIIPASIQPVSLPATTGSVSGAKSSAKPVVIGAALGLLLGLVLLVGWERSDPRIADARGLSSQLGCPATPAERLSPDASRALLDRWRSLTDAVPARVAILPADAHTAPDAAALIDSLVAAGGGETGYVDARSGRLPDSWNGAGKRNGNRFGVVLVNPGAATAEGPGQAVALGCDLTVVVVRQGTRVTEVRRLAQDLGNFGIVPTWALLAGRAGPNAGGPRDRAPGRVAEHALSR